jgi:hypothetical protein
LNEIVSLPEVKNVRSKIWFLASACAVIALTLGLWWSMGGEKKTGQDAVVQVQDKQDKIVTETGTSECPRLQKKTREDAPPVPLEEKTGAVTVTGWDEAEPEPEQKLVTIQGVVEYMDGCTQTIVVDGISIDASQQGNFPDYYQAYKEGDFVELTYIEKKSSKLLHSVEMLQKKLN